MDKIYKVAVIGGGASGITSAIMLSELFGDEVVLLERLSRVGKKLTVTGNGRGNVTNEKLECANYHSVEGRADSFVKAPLSAFGNMQVKDFLRSLGIMVCSEAGRVYPASFQASSVLDLMRYKLESTGCGVMTEFNAVKIKKGEYYTVISDSGKKIKAEKIIIAVGGKCQKQLGTDGTGYSLCEGFGHTVTALYPSLVQLKTDVSDIKALKGVRQEVSLSLFDGEALVAKERGDVIFTEFGISGNAVFQISSFVPRVKRPVVSISFLPELSHEDLVIALTEKIKNTPYLNAEDLLTGYVNKQIGRVVLKRVGVDLQNKCPLSRINAIVDVLKGFVLPVVGSLGFNYAQVTRGGIRTDEVDSQTMESLLKEGLYLTGEVLDVDGDCGGYNLQWAFSSAYVASSDIAKKYGVKLKEVER